MRRWIKDRSAVKVYASPFLQLQYFCSNIDIDWVLAHDYFQNLQKTAELRLPPVDGVGLGRKRS